MRYFIILLILFLPAVAFGQPTITNYSSPINATTIQQAIQLVLDFVVTISIPLATLAIMVAGFLYVTSGGSEDRAKQANQAITYSVIGLLVALSAQFLRDVVIGIAGGAAAADSFAKFITNIVRAGGQVLVGLSVLAVLYSAFLFVTGGEDQAKIQTAKRVLTYAIIGLFIATLSFFIPNLIETAVKGIVPR